MRTNANLQGFVQHQNTSARITQKRNGAGAELVSGRSSRLGKSITWIKTTLRPGTAKTENRNVTRLLIQSLATEYGAGVGRVAARNLQADLDSGKKLTGATIRSTFQAVNQELRQRRVDNNNDLIQRYTTYDANDPGNTFGRLLSSTVAADNMTNRVDALRIDRVVRQVTDRLTASSNNGDALLSENDVRSVAQDAIKDELQTIKNADTVVNLATATGVGVLDPSVRNVLHTVENNVMTEKEATLLFGVARAVQADADTDLGEFLPRLSSFSKLTDSSYGPSEICTILNRCTTAVSESLEDAGAQEVYGATETMINGLVESGQLNQAGLQRIYSTLTSPVVLDYHAALDVVFMDRSRVARTPEQMEGLQDVARITRTMRAIVETAGRSLGIADAQVNHDFAESVPELDSTNEMSAHASMMLQHAGINDAEFHGQRVNNKACSAGFVAELERQLQPVTSFSTEGISTAAEADFTRADYSIDGTTLAHGAEKTEFLKKFQLQAGSTDADRQRNLRAITSIANQTIFGSFLMASAQRSDGPVECGFGNGGQSIDYDIRTDDLRGPRVDVHFRAPLLGLSSGVAEQKLDRDQSFIEMTFSVVVDQASIDSGNPTFAIENAIYSSHLVPMLS